MPSPSESAVVVPSALRAEREARREERGAARASREDEGRAWFRVDAWRLRDLDDDFVLA